jgi:hypothetical protein
MNTPNRILLNELAAVLGLSELLSHDEDLLILSFEEAPALSLSLDGDEALIAAVRLGLAPPDDPELLEELLASNLMFRDTEGATLSLERHTRQVFLARRWSTAELATVQGLESALRDFIGLAEVWLQAFPRLIVSSDADGASFASESRGPFAQRV